MAPVESQRQEPCAVPPELCPHMHPCAAGGVGQAVGEGCVPGWHRVSPWGQGKGHSQRMQLQAGWLVTPPLPWLRAPLPSQALHRTAAAQLPPALSVLHGDRGAPVHVLLRVLPGKLLGSLRGRHARRGQLRARAPLCHWQCPQEETAPAAAGPGEPRREGDMSCGDPQPDSAPQPGCVPWALQMCG